MVLQLCGRVCRRLSLVKPVFLDRLSFFIAMPSCLVNRVRRLYFNRSAKAGSILKPVEQQILSIIVS